MALIVIAPSVLAFLAIIQAPTGSPREIVSEIQTLLGETETPDRLMRVEVLLRHLQGGEDPSRAVLEPRIQAHAEMLRRYRTREHASSAVRHANWLIAAERELQPDVVRQGPVKHLDYRNLDDVGRRRELRAKFATAFIDAFLTMARSVESAGDPDKAIWWLQLGERRMYDIEQARTVLRQEVERIRRTEKEKLGGAG
jgi:hypothetical protein